MPLPEPKKDETEGKRRNNEREVRSLPIEKVELRIEGDGGDREIFGYAAVFYDPADPGTEYRLWEDIVERIMPGAFDASLAAPDDVRILFNHDPNQILGRTTAGTATVGVDEKGFWFRVKPGDTTTGRDVSASIERGDVDGASFSFKVPEGGVRYRQAPDGTYIREVLTALPVYDGGPVVFPAYETAISGYRTREQVAIECRATLAAKGTVREKLDELVALPGAPPKPEPEDEVSRKMKKWMHDLNARQRDLTTENQ